MPLRIIRNDITKVKADAIVNTANPKPMIGAGTDSAVYKAAGQEKLLAARKLIGEIKPGAAIETSAYNLDAKYIIHTVCVPWKDGNSGELDILADCYHNSLILAQELNCKSIVFPLIGTGSYGIPHDDAMSVARGIIKSFIKETNSSMTVNLVLFDKESLKSGEAISKKIKEYIDENYVEDAVADEYSGGLYPVSNLSGLQYFHLNRDELRNLNININDAQKPFAHKVFEYVEQKGIKDSALYGGKYELYFPKQILSNMRKDYDYHPSKYVCVVICLVLKLNLHDTLDLLERAGWALSRSRKADVVVRGCIENGIYDINEIDDALENNGCDELRKIK